MKKVFRLVLIGIAICTIAIPDMGSELFRRLRGMIRDVRNKSTDTLHDLANSSLGKSPAEKR